MIYDLRLCTTFSCRVYSVLVAGCVFLHIVGFARFSSVTLRWGSFRIYKWRFFAMQSLVICAVLHFDALWELLLVLC